MKVGRSERLRNVVRTDGERTVKYCKANQWEGKKKKRRKTRIKVDG
jgi:hypothetical protein